MPRQKLPLTNYYGVEKESDLRAELIELDKEWKKLSAQNMPHRETIFGEGGIPDIEKRLKEIEVRGTDIRKKLKMFK